jgi:hypothetical protein
MAANRGQFGVGIHGIHGMTSAIPCPTESFALGDLADHGEYSTGEGLSILYSIGQKDIFYGNAPYMGSDRTLSPAAN